MILGRGAESGRDLLPYPFSIIPMTSEDLDRAETAAHKRAVGAAYDATEGVDPAVQRKVFHAMKSYIETGIRLMREELDKLI